LADKNWCSQLILGKMRPLYKSEKEIKPMPHTKIKNTLNELKGELEKLPKETGKLESAIEQMKGRIEHDTPETLQEHVQTLQNEILELEIEHPRLIALLNQISTALSNLGI
jgi:predicted  nucleic acid-binding Zn-ribbon protein